MDPLAVLRRVKVLCENTMQSILARCGRTTLLALLVTFSICQVSTGQEVKWLRSAKQAAKQAATSGKPILIYVRSENCHYCDLMQKNVWQDGRTADFIRRNFIPLKLTKEENGKAVEAMKVKGYPSTIIFSPKREYLARIDGYVPPEEFMGTDAGLQSADAATATTR